MEMLIIWGIILFVSWKLFLGKWVKNRPITKAVKATYTAHQIPDEDYYELASKEIRSGNIREGLWAKAWSQAQGDENKAQAAYIKLRVEAMRREFADALNTGKAPPNPPNDSRESTVVHCPQCSKALRVASNKRLRVKCPKCQNQFEART